MQYYALFDIFDTYDWNIFMGKIKYAVKFQWITSLRPKAQPRVIENVFTDLPKLCSYVYLYFFNMRDRKGRYCNLQHFLQIWKTILKKRKRYIKKICKPFFPSNSAHFGCLRLLNPAHFAYTCFFNLVHYWCLRVQNPAHFGCPGTTKARFRKRRHAKWARFKNWGHTEWFRLRKQVHPKEMFFI